MKVIWTVGGGYNEETVQEIVSVESFVLEKLLHYANYRAEMRLENQPTEIAKALSRLLKVLVRKGLLSHAEFFEVLEVDDTDRYRVDESQ